VLTGSIMPRTGFTPYLRLGNWPVLALVYLGLAAGFAGWRMRRGGAA
jgi:apolipoprotein N-acyltransferase